MSASARKSLPKKDFAIPSKREFPIQNKAHREAAAMDEKFVGPATRKKVKAALAKKKKKGK